MPIYNAKMSLLAEILFKNRLSHPDGRPLFRYRLTGLIPQKLDECAKDYFSQMPENQRTALFCLWASRHLRSTTDEISGKLSWQMLGLSQLNQKTLVEWTDQGLKILQRPLRLAVDDSRLRLATLYLEGGIPLRTLQTRYWKEIISAFETLRQPGLPVPPEKIVPIVDEIFVDASELQKQALNLFLLGLTEIDADPELSHQPTARWSDENLIRASNCLQLNLQDDLQWLDDLFALKPRKKQFLTRTGNWWFSPAKASTHPGELKFGVEFPQNLPFTSGDSTKRVYLLHDGEQSFMARYNQTREGLRLDFSQNQPYNLDKPWTEVRLVAKDDQDQLVDFPLKLSEFSPPEFPLFVRLESTEEKAWLVPANWQILTGEALFEEPGAKWLLARETTNVCFRAPDNQEITCDASALKAPKLDGGKPYDGAFYQGKPVKLQKPQTPTGWVSDRESGLIRFSYVHEGKVKKRTYEVILPGLRIEGRIVLGEHGLGTPRISWSLTLPAGWQLKFPSGTKHDKDWKFTTELVLNSGEEVGQDIQITDGEQSIPLTCYPSAQIFFQKDVLSPLQEERELLLWKQELNESWWLFKTRRAKRLTLNQRSYDLETEVEITPRPGLVFLKTWQNDFVPMESTPESDPLIERHQLEIRVYGNHERYESGYHDELILKLQNYAVIPNKDKRELLGRGQDVTLTTNTSSYLSEFPELFLRALWAPQLPPIQVEYTGTHWRLPLGWDSFPQGMYLLTSPQNPEWMRPTLIPLATTITPQNLSAMQTISRGEVVLQALEASNNPQDSIQSISIRLYRELFRDLVNNPEDSDWTNLWLLSNELHSLGIDFLFQFQALFQMLLEGGSNGLVGFLGLCWTLRAGLMQQKDETLVEYRAKRLFKRVTVPSPQPVEIKIKDFAQKQNILEALKSILELIPESWLATQGSLKSALEFFNTESFP